MVNGAHHYRMKRLIYSHHRTAACVVPPTLRFLGQFSVPRRKDTYITLLVTVVNGVAERCGARRRPRVLGARRQFVRDREDQQASDWTIPTSSSPEGSITPTLEINSTLLLALTRLFESFCVSRSRNNVHTNATQCSNLGRETERQCHAFRRTGIAFSLTHALRLLSASVLHLVRSP